MDLSQILDSDSTVIIDNCTLGGTNEPGKTLLYRLFDCQDYTQMDALRLNKESMQLSSCIELVSRDNVCTIPEVAAEFYEYLRIVSDKLSFIERIRRGGVRNKGHTDYKRAHKDSSRAESSGSHLREIQEKAFCLYQQLRRKTIRIPRSADYLTEMIKLIDRAQVLKRDTYKKYGNVKVLEEPRSDTDERLITALYWQAMFSNSPPVLFTADSDNIRLLIVSTRLLASDDFHPYNSFYKKRILENPFRLIFFYNGEPTEPFKLSELRHVPRFNLSKVSQQESREIRDRIYDLFQSFYEETREMAA